MKPTGLALTCRGGAVVFEVRRSSGAEDAVWDAVERAREAGWDAQRLIAEVHQAWDYAVDQDAKAQKDDMKNAVQK